MARITSLRMYTTMLSCMRGISTSVRLQFKHNKYYGIIDRATNNVYRQYRRPIVEKLNGGGGLEIPPQVNQFKLNVFTIKNNYNYNEIEMCCIVSKYIQHNMKYYLIYA